MLDASVETHARIALCKGTYLVTLISGRSPSVDICANSVIPGLGITMRGADGSMLQSTLLLKLDFIGT